jgi:hypothetical protein
LRAAALAQEPDAVRLLREIHQLEINRKRHGHVPGLLHGKILDRRGQLPLRLDVAPPAALREQAQALLQIEDRLAFELHDHFAENAAQLPDLRGKGIGFGFRGWSGHENPRCRADAESKRGISARAAPVLRLPRDL